MKTTLNLPEALISHAKILAVQEKTTLTQLIIQGLEIRIGQSKVPRGLPVSTEVGGLKPGMTWEGIHHLGDANEAFR